MEDSVAALKEVDCKSRELVIVKSKLHTYAVYEVDVGSCLHQCQRDLQVLSPGRQVQGRVSPLVLLIDVAAAVARSVAVEEVVNAGEVAAGTGHVEDS